MTAGTVPDDGIRVDWSGIEARLRATMRHPLHLLVRTAGIVPWTLPGGLSLLEAVSAAVVLANEQVQDAEGWPLAEGEVNPFPSPYGPVVYLDPPGVASRRVVYGRPAR